MESFVSIWEKNSPPLRHEDTKKHKERAMNYYLSATLSLSVFVAKILRLAGVRMMIMKELLHKTSGASKHPGNQRSRCAAPFALPHPHKLQRVRCAAPFALSHPHRLQRFRCAAPEYKSGFSSHTIRNFHQRVLRSESRVSGDDICSIGRIHAPIAAERREYCIRVIFCQPAFSFNLSSFMESFASICGKKSPPLRHEDTKKEENVRMWKCENVRIEIHWCSDI